jgi:hypothetical protein
MQPILDAVTPWTPILVGVFMLLSVLFGYPSIKWKRVLWVILGAYVLGEGINSLWKSY